MAEECRNTVETAATVTIFTDNEKYLENLQSGLSGFQTVACKLCKVVGDSLVVHETKSSNIKFSLNKPFFKITEPF